MANRRKTYIRVHEPCEELERFREFAKEGDREFAIGQFKRLTSRLAHHSL